MAGVPAFKHILMEASYKIPFRSLRRVRAKVWTRSLSRLVGEVCTRPLSRLYQQGTHRQPPSFLFLPAERKASGNGTGRTKFLVQGFRRGGSSGSTRTVMFRSTSRKGAQTLYLPTHLPKPFPCRKFRIVCLLFQHIASFSSLPQSIVQFSSFPPCFALPSFSSCLALSPCECYLIVTFYFSRI